MGTRFKKSRFHIDFGPKELFDRVLFKMSGVRCVKTTKHFLERSLERNIPEKILQDITNFNCNDWRLKTVEVREDTGKFVNSTWEKEYNGLKYWITIGFGNVLETIVIKNGEGKGEVITEGELYDFVKKVNEQLQKEDKQNENSICH